MPNVDIIQLLKQDGGEKFYPVTHVDAVIGLKDASFFELIPDTQDPTKYSVKLKPEYTGLWAEGWIAAGGIGTGGGGGGGGGLIQTVYTWSDMQEMSSSPEDDTTSAFNAKTVYEIYKQLQTGGGGYLKDSSGGFFLTSSSEKILLKGEGHSLSSLSDVSIYNPSVNDLLIWSGYSWVNVPQSSVRPDLSGYVTLETFNGAVTTLQAEIAAITSFFEEDASHNITLKSPYQNLWVPGWIAAGGIGTGGGGGGGSTVVLSNVKDTGTALATISVDGTPYTIKNAIVWGTPDNTNHKVTVTVDGGTPMTLCLDGYSSGGGSTDLPTVWNSLTNTVQDAYANTKIDLAHIPNITASMVSDWNNVYTLRTPVSTTAANGTLLGVDALSNASSSTAGSDNSRIAWDSDHNAWHIYGNLYADGWVAAGGIGSASGGYYLRQLSDIYHNTTNILRANGGDVQNGDILVYDSANTRWVAAANSGGSTFNGGEITEDLWLHTTSSHPNWGSKLWFGDKGSGAGYVYLHEDSDDHLTIHADKGITLSVGSLYSVSIPNLEIGGAKFNITSPSNGQGLIYSDGTWVNGSVGGVSSVTLASGTQNGTLKLTVVNNGNTTVTDNIAVTGLGSLAYKSSLLASDIPSLAASKITSGTLDLARIPDLSSLYVTLDTDQNNITGEKTFQKPLHVIVPSGGLSYIDIGEGRLEWDDGASAIRVTKRTGSATVSLYADGSVSAGGTAASASRNIVFTDGNQTIDGEKTFTGRIVFNGTNLGDSDYGIDASCDSRFTNILATGKAVFSTRVGIGGQANNSYALYVTGAQSLTGSLTVGGDATITSGLGVGTAWAGNSNKLVVNGTAIATAWNTTSDGRLKENIMAISCRDAISSIMMLKPSTWTWKGDGKLGAGLIAQDVESVFPFMVSDGEYKSLNYQMLHAYELSAIQDHELRIRELEKHSI